MTEFMQIEGQVVLQLSRRCYSCVAICYHEKVGWELQCDCSVAMPDIPSFLQKHHLATVR